MNHFINKIFNFFNKDKNSTINDQPTNHDGHYVEYSSHNNINCGDLCLGRMIPDDKEIYIDIYQGVNIETELLPYDIPFYHCTFLDYDEIEKYSSKKVEEYENEGYDVINLVEKELN